MRECQLRELGRVDYGQALEWQQRLVAARQRGEIPDQLLLLEHPHVITLGRNGQPKNLLASGEAVSIVTLQPGDEVLVALEETGRHFGHKIQETILEK